MLEKTWGLSQCVGICCCIGIKDKLIANIDRVGFAYIENKATRRHKTEQTELDTIFTNGAYIIYCITGNIL